MNLQGKTVIVTGASAGIWEAIAQALAAQNTKLALIARSQDKLESVAEKCRELWAEKVEVYNCDISHTAQISATIENINSDFWAIDVLINNAGIWQKMMQLDGVEKDMIDPIIQTNLSGVIHMTHAALPYMREQDEAAIINVSSKSGVTFQGGQSIYTATKHWVRGFTDVLKEDLKETNIRVAGVYQAGTNTSMFANTGETMPIEKFTDPADLANVVTFMLSQPAKIWLHDVRVQF